MQGIRDYFSPTILLSFNFLGQIFPFVMDFPIFQLSGLSTHSGNWEVLKLNFDAAIKGRKAAQGFVIRDFTDSLLWAAGTLISNASVKYAELVAA